MVLVKGGVILNLLSTYVDNDDALVLVGLLVLVTCQIKAILILNVTTQH